MGEQELSADDKLVLSKTVKEETREQAGAWLTTWRGILVSAIWASFGIWLVAILNRKDDTPDVEEGAPVIEMAIAAAGVILLPWGVYRWLSISAWKRKAFELQAGNNQLEAKLNNRYWDADRAIADLTGREVSGIGCRTLFIKAFMLESRLPDPFAVPEIEFWCFGTVGSAQDSAVKLQEALDEFGLVEITGPPPTTRHAAIRLRDPKGFQWWKKTRLAIDVIARIKQREAMSGGPLKLERYRTGLYAGADPSTQESPAEEA